MDNIQVAKIIKAFSEYRKAGDESLIRDFPPEQIRKARDRKVHPENDTLLWQTMTGWITNHSEPGERKRSNRTIKTEFWEEGYFRLFISHSSLIRDLAHELSEKFKEFAISAFVAHDDIEPAKEWQATIEDALQTCDGLIALLNDQFSSSKWTDQEVGICLGRHKIIIPVRLGIDPYGFMGKYQGLKGKGKSVPIIVDEVFSLLVKKEVASEKLSAAIVRMFCDSKNFIDTSNNWPKLEKVTYLDHKLLEQLRSAIANNDQIYGYSNFPKPVEKFIDEWESKLNARVP